MRNYGLIAMLAATAEGHDQQRSPVAGNAVRAGHLANVDDDQAVGRYPRQWVASAVQARSTKWLLLDYVYT
jgi:hypothetical protein